MGRICENIVGLFIKLFFEQRKEKNSIIEKKEKYTLSSVFPTSTIMDEVKKYI